MVPLKSVFVASNALLTSKSNPSIGKEKESLSRILRARINSFEQLAAELGLGWQQEEEGETKGDDERTLKMATARRAIFLLQLVEQHTSSSPPQPSTSSSAPPPPLFGLTDLKNISTLAGIVARWGIGCNRAMEGILPASLRDGGVKKSGSGGRFEEIVEVDDQDGKELEGLLKGLLEIVLLPAPSKVVDIGLDGKRQFVGAALPQTLTSLLGGLIWLSEEGLDEEGRRWGKVGLDKLFKMTSPTTLLPILLLLRSSASSQSLKTVLSRTLSSQLLLTTGVRSLFLTIFSSAAISSSSSEDDQLNIQKLDMVSRLLLSASTESPLGLESILMQLGKLVDDSVPPEEEKGKGAIRSPPPENVTRASCYVLAQISGSTGLDENIINRSLLKPLHAPFLPATYLPPTPPASESTFKDPITTSPSAIYRALQKISLLLLYSPPATSSHSIQRRLLDPIVPSLLSLKKFLLPTPADEVSGRVGIVEMDEGLSPGKTLDKPMEEELDSLLESWGKGSFGDSVEELVNSVRGAVEALEEAREFGVNGNEGYYWSNTSRGVCVRVGRKEGEEVEMNLKVDPEGVVGWLKSIDRKKVSGGLFLRWLDEVAILRSESGFEAAKKSVLRLQLVLKMVDELGSEILNEDPSQIVAFVTHVLSSLEPIAPTVTKSKSDRAKKRSGGGISLADLKIVEDEDIEDPDEVEEVEEMPELALGGDEMVVTALTLLMAVLEGNPDMNMNTTPLLSVIHSQLTSESFTSRPTSSELLPSLAQEARLVLSAIKASSYATSSTQASVDDPYTSSRQKYQEALKLLQDPLLPVRTQGLTILRSLVLSKTDFLDTDPALLPAILDIFVQAIEDEDSYLYLNAIQGLSSMVDVYGKQIAKRLVGVYLGAREKVTEVGQGDKGRRELDKRLRIAETLSRVVQRAGEAFAVFVDDIVPPLLAVVGASTVPAPLRSSALSVLATAIDTAPTALMSYSDVLAETCLTLLSIESRPLQPIRPSKVDASPPPQLEEVDTDDEVEIEKLREEFDPSPPPLDRHGKLKKPEETPDPTSTNSKHPALRRAALVFLAMLFRTAERLQEDSVQQSYDSHNPLSTFRLSSSTRSMSKKSEIVSLEVRARARTVLGYIEQTDEDGLVRHQAGEVLAEL